MSSYLDFQIKNFDKLINQISKAERQVKYISDLDSFVNKNLIGGREEIKAVEKVEKEEVKAVEKVAKEEVAKVVEEVAKPVVKEEVKPVVKEEIEVAKVVEDVVLEEAPGILLTIENINSLVKNETRVLVGSELEFKDNELIFLERHNEHLYFLGINKKSESQISKQLSVSIDELAKMKIFISNDEFLNTNIREKAKDFQIVYKFAPPNIPKIKVDKEEMERNLASIISSVKESIKSLKATKAALEQSKAAEAELKQKSDEAKRNVTELELKVSNLEGEIEELKRSGSENTDDIREKDSQISKLKQELENEKKNYSQALDSLNAVIEINKQHEEHNEELNKLLKE